MLDNITPIVLTYNEEPNIARTLRQLSWARSVIVMDSFSTDRTLQIVSRFANVRVIQHTFENFARQWEFVLREGCIETPWVLAMDADYVLTPELIDEIANVEFDPSVSGYRCTFRYCVDGRPLRGSLYPASIVLFRLGSAHYIQDGHAYRLHVVRGHVLPLQSKILHDDRKSMERWLISQEQYARLELEKLRRTPLSRLSWPDRIRRVPFAAPFIIPWYCLFVKGVALDGVPGVSYAVQRTVAELLLSLMLVSEDGESSNG